MAVALSATVLGPSHPYSLRLATPRTTTAAAAAELPQATPSLTQVMPIRERTCTYPRVRAGKPLPQASQTLACGYPNPQVGSRVGPNPRVAPSSSSKRIRAKTKSATFPNTSARPSTAPNPSQRRRLTSCQTRILNFKPTVSLSQSLRLGLDSRSPTWAHSSNGNQQAYCRSE